ncbi:F0F1 ATP synthase subunit epsilon [Flavobacteriaceae bacterium]|nr:F0F1 ATP synthase subunit epsilon [Flavobacteriaceae bacterium]MDB4326576.1 F0F1 ATP synthase subunit epsilon [Flavobacteriaceae bacterium]
MYLEIVSPEVKLFSGEVESLTVPGASGSFQVLNNHAPIVSTLTKGQVKIQGKLKLDDANKGLFSQEGNFTFFEIQSGAIEMRDNKVILLTD